MYSEEKKAEARALRLKGETISSISKKIGVERTSVGRWCKDIELTAEQRAAAYPRGRSPEQQKIARRKWYKENADKERARLRASNMRRYRLIRDSIRDYKVSLGCKRCGENHPACLDLHHRDRTQKKFAVATVLSSLKNHETIWEEVKKCDVLCANCHRKEHYLERQQTTVESVLE